MQRGHLYGYDNSYIIDAARRFPDRLLPVVILDTQDPATPAVLAQMARTQAVRGLRLANTRPAQLDTSWMASPAAMRIVDRSSGRAAPASPFRTALRHRARRPDRE